MLKQEIALGLNQLSTIKLFTTTTHKKDLLVNGFLIVDR